MANIMVVDDDDGVLEVVSTALELAGHKVSRACGGNKALDLYDISKEFDLMITDVIMPGLNGFNLARMARQRCVDLKILYLTGYHEMAITMRDEGIKYGKMLVKPILPKDLVREVDEALVASL